MIVVDASVLTDFLLGRRESVLADVWMVRHPHAPLRGRVWDRRHDLTAYDGTYLVLAEGLPDAMLVTGDGGLAARARATLGPERVCQVR